MLKLNFKKQLELKGNKMINNEKLSEARKEFKELHKPKTSPEVINAIREQIKKDRQLKIALMFLLFKLERI